MEKISNDLMFWSKDSLLLKAQRYSEIMYSHSKEEWQFAFWSTLTLELLSRGALANVSPVFLAESEKNNHNNLVFALGYSPKAPKFVPKSIPSTEVFRRLKDCIDGFDSDQENFCILHMAKRNEEIHTGSNAFEGLKNSSWLPQYYRVCSTLLNSMGEDLTLLLDTEEEDFAQRIMKAAKEESAKEVLKAIVAFKTVWQGKDPTERDTLEKQATVWASRISGHRVVCPSCGCQALVTGEPIASPKRTLEDDQIIEKQQYVPTKFECVACKLRITGLGQLSATGLGDTFVVTSTYDPAEYYEIEDEHPGYEDDNNEPF